MDEAVLFLFIKDAQVLLEKRPVDDGVGELMYLPGGGIEEKDKTGEEYRVNALKREIREELGEGVVPTQYDFLTTVEHANPLRMYHSYLIREWTGELPTHTMEDGTQHAELFWEELDEAFLILGEVGRMTIGKAISVLREADLADSYASLKDS